MTKIIKINECGQCPYLEEVLILDEHGYRIPKPTYGYHTKWVCSKTSMKTMEHNMPVWCPLGDVMGCD